MSIITFPKNEWLQIRDRLGARKEVYTIRVSNELGKYHVGDVLTTEWGDKVKIVENVLVNGGIEDLSRSYIHFKELDASHLKELKPFTKFEIIKFIYEN